MTITLTISRDNLPTPALPLTLADDGYGTYVIVDFDSGEAEPDLVTAPSKWLDGAGYVAHTLPLVVMPLIVRVYAPTYTEMRTATAALVAACRDQHRYTITETDPDGAVIGSYDCLPARPAVGGQPIEKIQGTQVVSLAIPRQP